MTSHTWAQERQNEAIAREYLKARNDGAHTLADNIIIANPQIDFVQLALKRLGEEEQTRINKYFDETEPPETV